MNPKRLILCHYFLKSYQNGLRLCFFFLLTTTLFDGLSFGASANGSCMNIAGNWHGSDTGSVTCTFGGQPEQQDINGSGEISVDQTDCDVSWSDPVYNALRTGMITGNSIQLSGIFAVPIAGNVNFTQNIYTVSGTVSENVITMKGSGIAEGTYCDDTGEICADFSCTGSDTVTLTRFSVNFLDKENTSREVIGAAADGSSAVIIQISGLAKDVTLSDIQVSVDEGDGNIDNDATILNGVYTVTYHAPEYFVREGHPEDISQGSRPIGLTITVNGEDAAPPSFYLTKPPVVLLHGLGGGKSTWTKLRSELETHGYKYILPFKYASFLHFDQLSRVIDNAINNVLRPPVNDGFVAKKADIVAHSMGGLVTKLYGHESNIHSITTIGTPHFGSPVADQIWSFINNPNPFVNFLGKTLAAVSWGFGEPLTYGAVEDLRVNGGNTCANNDVCIKNLENVPTYAISGISTVVGPNDILFDGYYGMLFQACMFIGEVKESDGPAALNNLLFHEEENDWVVSKSSQSGGVANTDSVPVEWHASEPDNEAIIQKVINFLHSTQANIPMAQTTEIKKQQVQKLNYSSVPLNIAISSGSVQITNPIAGGIFHSGDTVNIEVNISNGNAMALIVASTGNSIIIDHAPYIFQFKIPEEMVGPLTIMAGAMDNTGFIGSDEVTINISSTAHLTDLNIYPEITPLYLPPGELIPLSIYGSYDDNVTRDITLSGCGTTYVSSNSDVAEVTLEGLITVKSPGQTTITVTNSGISKQMIIIGESTVLQGTVGTRFTLQGSGFGSRKPTVYVEYEKTPGLIKKVSAKVESYSDTSITCLWTNTLPPGTYNLKVLPKIKGSAPISIDTFSIENPVISGVTPNTGKVADKITVDGMFFSSKKPKIYLEDPSTLKRKSCKVLSSTMDPETGLSSLQFVVPKLGSGDYNIILHNVIGETANTFTIP